ncbi:lysine exporter LysO family protein [Saccharolobus sp.]|uniref:lysine exporter LysO family protein n=1 Tax=Saccharolobus sp. TaxID=2100761 RepID=UPI003964850E
MNFESILFIVLYILFLIVGKIKYVKIVEKFVDAIVLLLIFSISYWAGEEILGKEIYTLILSSIILSILSIFITYFSGILLDFYYSIKDITENKIILKIENNNKSMIKYMSPFVLGWLLGALIHFNTQSLVNLIDYELYILASILGYIMGKEFNLGLILNSSRNALLSILITIIGDIIVALIIFVTHIANLPIALAITLASGWYSYVGPLVAVTTNPYLGTLAFLINFLREQLTYVLIPVLLKLKFEPRSAIAVGGATAMDTTLPLYVETLGKEYALSAMVSGVILTLVIPIILPLII